MCVSAENIRQGIVMSLFSRLHVSMSIPFQILTL